MTLLYQECRQIVGVMRHHDQIRFAEIAEGYDSAAQALVLTNLPVLSFYKQVDVKKLANYAGSWWDFLAFTDTRNILIESATIQRRAMYIPFAHGYEDRNMGRETMYTPLPELLRNPYWAEFHLRPRREWFGLLGLGEMYPAYETTLHNLVGTS